MGIIGLEKLGTMVAKTACHFKMNVFYFNRSRKKELEKEGITYQSFDDMVKNCDIITTHLPKNTILLKEYEFQNNGYLCLSFDF